MARRKGYPTRGLPAMHPGELLREDVMPALGKSVAETARLLHVSRQTLHAILREEAPITPAMALKLGKLCGNGPAHQTIGARGSTAQTRAGPVLTSDRRVPTWREPPWRASRSAAFITRPIPSRR